MSIFHYSWYAIPPAGVPNFQHRLTLLDAINAALAQLKPGMTDTVPINCGAKAALVVACLPFAEVSPGCYLSRFMGCPVTIEHDIDMLYKVNLTGKDAVATIDIIGLSL